HPVAQEGTRAARGQGYAGHHSPSAALETGQVGYVLALIGVDPVDLGFDPLQDRLDAGQAFALRHGCSSAAASGRCSSVSQRRNAACPSAPSSSHDRAASGWLLAAGRGKTGRGGTGTKLGKAPVTGVLDRARFSPPNRLIYCLLLKGVGVRPAQSPPSARC